METFLACDGHQRMEGGPVLGVWRRILEPVFHFFVIRGTYSMINRPAVPSTHRYLKGIRRLDLRCLRRCQRENRELGQACLKK